MPVCAAIKPDGTRCRRSADGPHGLCWGHAPENAAERRKQASRAARGKAGKEVRGLKTDIRDLIGEVKRGELDRNDAAVMIQGYRALKDFIELERRILETDQLAAEIEDLKREYGETG
jgi:hypothetical protein